MALYIIEQQLAYFSFLRSDTNLYINRRVTLRSGAQNSPSVLPRIEPHDDVYPRC